MKRSMRHGGTDEVRVTDNGDGTVTHRFYLDGKLVRVDNVHVQPCSPGFDRTYYDLAVGTGRVSVRRETETMFA